MDVPCLPWHGGTELAVADLRPSQPDLFGEKERHPRSREVAVQESADFILQAQRDWYPYKTYVLFSGGNDSLVLLDLCIKNGWAPHGAIHVNTGTGVPETTEFVRDTCSDWGIALHELHPPLTYEELFIGGTCQRCGGTGRLAFGAGATCSHCEGGGTHSPIIDGLPGPGMHHIAYTRLKERALMRFTTDQKSHRMDKILLLSGVRKDESQRRMGYGGTVIDQEGCRVWVNPLYYWTNDEMAGYKADHNLPRNPVSEHLHMSGECLCGAFAKPGELEEIRFFYPEVAARIDGWNEAAKAAGLTYCEWGTKRPGKKDKQVGPMCSTCISFFDEEAS